MTTSCAPVAGRLANRSGSPRPEASGSAPASAVAVRERGIEVRHDPHLPAAVVTQRVELRRRAVLVAGGERVALGIDRLARRHVEERARARAALARDDHPQARERVDAQLRQGESLGKALLHGHVLDALLDEGRPVLLVPGALVERPARRSGRAARSTPRRPPWRSGRPRAGSRRPRSSPRRSCSTASRPRRATWPLNSSRQVPITHAVVHRHDVRGLGVAPVLVGLERHALLVAEDALAQLQRRRQLGLRACLADLHRQRA